MEILLEMVESMASIKPENRIDLLIAECLAQIELIKLQFNIN